MVAERGSSICELAFDFVDFVLSSDNLAGSQNYNPLLSNNQSDAFQHHEHIGTVGTDGSNNQGMSAKMRIQILEKDLERRQERCTLLPYFLYDVFYRYHLCLHHGNSID